MTIRGVAAKNLTKESRLFRLSLITASLTMIDFLTSRGKAVPAKASFSFVLRSSNSGNFLNNWNKRRHCYQVLWEWTEATVQRWKLLWMLKYAMGSLQLTLTFRPKGNIQCWWHCDTILFSGLSLPCPSHGDCYSALFIQCHRLVGVVVKASASRVEDPGFDSCLHQDFFGSKT